MGYLLGQLTVVDQFVFNPIIDVTPVKSLMCLSNTEWTPMTDALDKAIFINDKEISEQKWIQTGIII